MTGADLRKFRTSHGITLEDLAAHPLVDRSVSGLSRYENGSRRIPDGLARDLRVAVLDLELRARVGRVLEAAERVGAAAEELRRTRRGASA